MKNNISCENKLQIAMSEYNAGNLSQSEQLYYQILQQEPEHHHALFMLGVIARKYQKIDVAINYINKAIRLNSSIFQYHYELGDVFRAQGKFEAALVCYIKVAQLQPNDVAVHLQLGSIYQSSRRLDEAANSYQTAIRLKGNHAIAHNNLANVFVAQGKLNAAVVSFENALQHKPDFALALYNLGNVYKKQGNYEKAIDCYNRAIKIDPHFSIAFNGLICVMCQSEVVSAAAIYEQCRLFADQFESVDKYLPLKNKTGPNRRLKVGYVSGDFRSHAVANYIQPVLANHNRREVEVFCYYNHRHIDSHTKQLMKYADHWRSIVGLPDDQVATQVQQDGIDILVDLSGHTLENRLLVFALKPAPIQITWFGIPITTGLSSMDYRLTDKYMDPVGLTEQYHSETLVRHSSSNCFEPIAELPPVNGLPALNNGYITFGSFNNSHKINDAVITSWIKILTKLPKSRLLMVCPKHSQNKFAQSFMSHGINSERLRLLDKVPLSEYLALHNEIDIALDSFPYTGGTTTRYALWMGVPTVTVSGDIPVSRVSSSLMHHLGMEEYVANDADEYVKIALLKAKDIKSLSLLRMDLREKVKQAPFSKCKEFTRELESSYRTMWQKWCETQDKAT